jgi:ABC-type phosphate transport system substrate-binding protein
MKRYALLLTLALALSASGLGAQEFKVVVNAGSGVTQMAKDEVAKVFLKKARKLPDGTAAAPVDNDGAIRDAFSKAVHGRDKAAIESYWQQQIFSGQDVPPQKKPTDAQVLEYVRTTPGAIGYVSAGADLGSGVKPVAVTGM